MDNPYQSSSVNPNAPPSAYGSHNLEASQTAIYSLSSAKGWVRFMSVLLFILFGFIILGLFGLLVASAQMGMAGGVFILTLILYAVIIILLALRLGGYASAIGRLIHSRDPLDLETAMIQQMKFWRLSGIVMLIIIGLAILGGTLPLLFR